MSIVDTIPGLQMYHHDHLYGVDCQTKFIRYDKLFKHSALFSFSTANSRKITLGMILTWPLLNPRASFRRLRGTRAVGGACVKQLDMILRIMTQRGS